MTLLVLAAALILIGLVGLGTLAIAAWRAQAVADPLLEQKRRAWKDGE